MKALLNTMRLQARLEAAQRRTKQVAIVSSYDPNNYAVKVRLMPEDVETGWLPVASPWVGNGWGLFAPPSQNDVVDVHFADDNVNAGYVSLRLYTDRARPLNVAAGEFWLVHQSGSLLKFHNDGSVELTANAGLTIKATSIALQNAGSALKKLVNDSFISLFNSHVHSNGNNGANTGAPTATAGASNTTSITQAE